MPTSQGKFKEAARYFSEALRINPKDTDARRNLGKVHQMMKINHTFHSDVSSIKSK
jgi:tetratricopeptide (TPR) repeat protein